MDNIYFPTESLAELLGSLPEEDRLPRLLQSLGRLEAGGMPRKSVRAVERQLRQRLGLAGDDAVDRLPHIFVNCVPMGTQGIKLGFMNRPGAEELIKAQAHEIRSRLELLGCDVGDMIEPGQHENFFWFRAHERPQPPTVRELLEEYDDVIVR
ncbi:MAG TPA: hypothetical protein VGN42_21940 [Pirellulales bacterium]|jgi:hypothetical protein|nr:hypothetical protein [Pirellulales bacterium]